MFNVVDTVMIPILLPVAYESKLTNSNSLQSAFWLILPLTPSMMILCI